MYKEKMLPSGSQMFSKKVVEEPIEPSNDPKLRDRLRIQNEVFDIHDSLADTAKWVSLLTSTVIRIYQAMPEEARATIPAQDRYIIEYAITAFLASTTRADIQMQQEGTAMIDRIFQRQTDLANILT